MKILPGVWAYLAEKGSRLGRAESGNIFIIAQNYHKFMIDAGIKIGNQAKKLEKRILQDEHNFEEIQAIIVTHGHADHINGIRYFQQNFPTFKFGVENKRFLS